MKPLATHWQQKWLGLELTHARLQTLADVAEQFCINWIHQTPNPGMLFICGITGTGKSHVAAGIERFCRLSRQLAINRMPGGATRTLSTGSWRWPVLADEFRAKNLSVLPDLFSTDFVLLDDVGAENDPWKEAADKFCQVLSQREHKFTVITSNLTPPEFAATDPRITDRLLRNSRVMDLAGVPSFSEWMLLNKRAA
jgi:DNA replication protein DnaC